MNLRKYAKGRECMVRLPGCTCNPDETVLAHLRTASTGMGQKEDDIFAAWACSACHDAVDGRRRIEGWSREEIQAAFWNAIYRTQKQLIKEKILRW